MDERAEFDKRLTQVRQAMRDKGLQTLLIHDSGRHNFLRFNYVAYLTDFISVHCGIVMPIRLRSSTLTATFLWNTVNKNLP